MSGFGLYVHWPFCARKCPYCDFNSYARVSCDEAGWLSGVQQEMEAIAALQGAERPRLDSLFFGGGTPSLMAGASVAGVISKASALWGLAPECEITLEANPASAEAARFSDYAAAGVNRLSLGVQSLREASLRFLSRLHGVAEARAALALAQKTFARVSFDLIYALPGQSVAAWREELAEALALGTGHLSLYQLTIEPVTPFATMAERGAFRMPEEDLASALYQTTCEMTAAAGLPAYEVSNYARPDAQSRHNLNYWRYGAYGGVGPGAHGRLDLFDGRFATVCERRPERWADMLKRTGHGFSAIDPIPSEEAAREHLLMNLRLYEGLDLAVYRARWGVSPSAEKITMLTDLGLVSCVGDRLAVSARGMLVLNSVIAELAR